MPVAQPGIPWMPTVARPLACALLALLLVAPGRAALARSDEFLAGYVTALLEQRFAITGMDVLVSGGVLRLDPGVLPADVRSEIVAALSTVEGLQVELLAPPAVAVAAPMAPAEGRPVLLVSSALGILPREKLFDELVADPRWPRFSATVQFWGEGTDLDIVGAADLGGTLPIYGWTALGGQWQVAVQAGVFSIFDLESDSTDLINADYLVGFPLAVRYGPFSSQLRILHHSGHLGDEFVLRGVEERINLSYETVDALASFEAFDFLRVYGGIGAIVRSEPDLDPLRVQAGVELTGPEPLIGALLYPVAAFDYQNNQESAWHGDFSVRAGLELRTAFLEERRLQFMFEYFNGRSPNGQFFDQDLEYFGTGLHFFF